MSFISVEFCLFFAFLCPTYYLLTHRFRIGFLLVASYVFYASSRLEYVPLILFVTISDYVLAQRIHSSSGEARRRQYLWLAVFTNLSILFFFKYFNFFSAATADLLQVFSVDYSPVTIDVRLPLGISFYTFLGIAYVVDVYRGSIEPERKFATFALFVAFFPQLVAGPIERAGQMMSQFYRRVEFSYADAVAGLQLILWGIFKKIVVADRLAIYVNEVYGNPYGYAGPTLIIATVFFAFQIYCDFSGYCDIAIGVARVLGFRLMRNFRQPYFALSIREFWQRWHISLSTWFRDYVYFPLAARLGGSSILGVHVSFVTLFILSGLWHGANWTFVIWGGLHGLYLVCEYTIQRWTLWAQPSAEWVPLVWSNKYVACMFRAALTFSLVCVSWVFFRANSLQDAWYILRHFLTFPAGSWTVLTKPLGAADSEFGRGIAAILLVNVIDGIDARYGWIDFLGSRPPIVRWAIYYGLTAGIVLIGIWGTQEFIYFKF